MGIQPVLTIQNQVYQSLKDEICSGGFMPGQKLQEQQLAQQFNVSRSPIREALRKLTADGLVEEIPNRGVFVRRFTAKDIEDIYEVRVMLEDRALLHLNAAVMAAHENEIVDLLDRMELAFRRSDMLTYLRLDTELHRMLVSLCNNDLLSALYSRVESHIAQFRRFSLVDPQRFTDSLEEHKGIVRHLFQGNIPEAQRVNQTHLLLARDKILEYFRQSKV